MKKALKVVGVTILVLIAVQLFRAYLEEREQYVVIDSVEFLNRTPDSYRITAHSPSKIYTITCTSDFGKENERVCEAFSAGDKIRYGTLGDIFEFFGDNRQQNNFKPWKIETTAQR